MGRWAKLEFGEKVLGREWDFGRPWKGAILGLGRVMIWHGLELSKKFRKSIHIAQ